tara:strand:- start:618 stop:1115 length:498 start_codon:yes stop_codon:yes gene_type:complete
MSENDNFYEKGLIQHADQGDSEAGRELLKIVASRIETREFDSPVFGHIASGIQAFLFEGVPLDRALGVESPPNKGGRPSKYDETELAAVDLLLRDHAHYAAEQAAEWIDEYIGADRRTVQRLRTAYDARYNKFGADKLMESLNRGDLIDLCGSMREKVAEVLPQT